MSSFGWLLDLLPAATPARKGVAPGVAESADVHGRTATTADEAPHLSHLPHPEITGNAGNAAATESHQYARAREANDDAGLDRPSADAVELRVVRCSTCLHWTADPLGGGGIGKCATGADATSWSAHDRRPVSPWPDARRYCAGWEGLSHGQQQ